MKNRLLIIVVAVLAITTTVQAQTPTNEEEANKMMDSIMNKMPPGMRNMMEQAMRDEEKRKAEKKQVKKSQKKSEQKRVYKPVVSEVKTKDNADSFYWLGKIASNTQGKFANWPHGKADIKISFYNRKSKTYSYLKIGEISNQGQVAISLPEIDFRKWKRIPIMKHHSEGDDLFGSGDRLGLEYSNENVTYFATRHSLRVMQGDNDLGGLSIANSVITNGNLNSPYGSGKAGDGYIAYWVYMSQANIVKEKEGNPNPSVDTNLEFKKGWNIVITRVEGKDPDKWENKFHTATTTLPPDAKYYFYSN